MSDKDIFEVESENNSITVKDVVHTVLYLVFVVFLTFLIIKYVGQRTVVSGSSMESTLSDGDNLIVNKISYRFSDPKRFDIIIFPYQYEDDTYFIKRIIGLPGETIQIDFDGNIYIDGQILEEDYGLETILDPGIASEPIKLGEDEYFVMGDNRNNSTDSRFANVGVLDRAELIGKVWVRIYPFNEMGNVDKGK